MIYSRMPLKHQYAEGFTVTANKLKRLTTAIKGTEKETARWGIK